MGSGLTRSQFLARSVRGGLGLLGAGWLAGSPRPAQAQAPPGDFLAIFANVGSALRPKAFLDVSANTDAAPLGTDVLFTVFAGGSNLGEFTIPTNAQGFASSAAAATAAQRNLFRLTGGEPGLVRGRGPTNATTATAVLHQRGPGARLMVAAPPAAQAVGTAFPITIGDTATGALLVANVSGSEVAVDVYVGNAGSPGTGKYTARIRDLSVGRIDLQPDDAHAHLVLVASGDVVVQLVIDDGRLNGLTCLPLRTCLPA
jgi:hypothetical protein